MNSPACRIWVSDPEEPTQYMVRQYAGDTNVEVAQRTDPHAVWGAPVVCEPDPYSVRRDTSDTELSIVDRVARASEIIRGDGLPTDWTLEQWVSGVMVKLGEAAFHAHEYREGINRVFPGNAENSLESFVHCMEAISAVAQHVIEDVESEPA